MQKLLLNLTGDCLVLLGSAAPVAGSAASWHFRLPLQPWQVFVLWVSGAIIMLTGMHMHHLAALAMRPGFEIAAPGPAAK